MVLTSLFGGVNERSSRLIFSEVSYYLRTYNIEVRMGQQRSGVVSTEISYAIWRFDVDGKLIDIITSIRTHNRWY